MTRRTVTCGLLATSNTLLLHAFLYPPLCLSAISFSLSNSPVSLHNFANSLPSSPFDRRLDGVSYSTTSPCDNTSTLSKSMMVCSRSVCIVLVQCQALYATPRRLMLTSNTQHRHIFITNLLPDCLLYEHISLVVQISSAFIQYKNIAAPQFEQTSG